MMRFWPFRGASPASVEIRRAMVQPPSEPAVVRTGGSAPSADAIAANVRRFRLAAEQATDAEKRDRHLANLAHWEALAALPARPE